VATVKKQDEIPLVLLHIFLLVVLFIHAVFSV